MLLAACYEGQRWRMGLPFVLLLIDILLKGFQIIPHGEQIVLVAVAVVGGRQERRGVLESSTATRYTGQGKMTSHFKQCHVRTLASRR